VFPYFLAPAAGLVLLIMSGVVCSFVLTRNSSAKTRSRAPMVFLGMALVAGGVVALLSNLNLLIVDWAMLWSIGWPTAIVVFGVALIVEALRSP